MVGNIQCIYKSAFTNMYNFYMKIELQVRTQVDNNQTDDELQDSQVATLTFQKEINIQNLLGVMPTEEIGIFFVIYGQTALFPLTREENDTNTVIGSSVVSFTIAGLQPGSILSKPILIDLRIVNPSTGTAEVGIHCDHVLNK